MTAPKRVVLVRDEHDFFLYEVDKVTDTRVYGRMTSGRGYSPQFIDRRRVVMWDGATGEHLERCRNALNRKKSAERAAHDSYWSELGLIVGRDLTAGERR